MAPWDYKAIANQIVRLPIIKHNLKQSRLSKSLQVYGSLLSHIIPIEKLTLNYMVQRI
jgi:hypothetical protein